MSRTTTLSLIVVLLAAAILPGCLRTTFAYNDRAQANVTEETRAFWLYGLLGPDAPFRADRLCPSGVASVETYASVGNICLSAITAGIYSPRTIRVACSAGSAHNFYLNEEDEVIAHEFVDASTGESIIVDDRLSGEVF